MSFQQRAPNLHGVQEGLGVSGIPPSSSRESPPDYNIREGWQERGPDYPQPFLPKKQSPEEILWSRSLSLPGAKGRVSLPNLPERLARPGNWKGPLISGH